MPTELVHQRSTRPAKIRLTATQLAALQPGEAKRAISDAAVAGLVLRVSPNGSTHWLFRYTWKKTRPRIALGQFPAIGLAEARKLAMECSEWLEKGVDPRRAARRHRRDGKQLLALKELSNGSRFVLPDEAGDGPENPKLLTRGVARLLPRFKALGIHAFTPRDLKRTGRTNLGRLRVVKRVAELVINHVKKRLEGTYDVYEYLTEKREALEAWAAYLRELKRRPIADRLKKAMEAMPAPRKDYGTEHKQASTNNSADFEVESPINHMRPASPP